MEETNSTILTGYNSIDTFTDGFTDGDLVLITGYHRGISELLADNIVANNCRKNRKVLLLCEFSKEVDVLSRLYIVDRYSGYRNNLIIDNSLKTSVDDLYSLSQEKDADLIVIRGISSISGNHFRGFSKDMISRLKLFSTNTGKPVIVCYNSIGHLYMTNDSRFIHGQRRVDTNAVDYELIIKENLTSPEHKNLYHEFELNAKTNRSFYKTKLKLLFCPETGTIFDPQSVAIKLMHNAKTLGLEAKDIIDFANFWKDRTNPEQNNNDLDNWCL